MFKEISLASDMSVPIAAKLVLDPIAVKEQITAIGIAMCAYCMENFIGCKGKRVHRYGITFVKSECDSGAKLSACSAQLAECDGGTIHVKAT